MADTNKPKSSKSPKSRASGKSAPPSGATPKSQRASSMRSSSPPSGPPSTIPGTSSGSGPYLIGAAVLAAAIAALLYMRCDGQKTEGEPQAQVAPTAAAPMPQAPVFAPPPPPEEEEDAGVDAGPAKAGNGAPANGQPKVASTGGAGVCAQCGKGQVSGALQTAVAQTGGLARGCYNRALRQGGAEGSIMVSVSVGSDGSLCGARVSNDTLGNPGLTQCVLGKFQGRSYPKPEKGCVVLNVPISFSMKQ